MNTKSGYFHLRQFFASFKPAGSFSHLGDFAVMGSLFVFGIFAFSVNSLFAQYPPPGTQVTPSALPPGAAVSQPAGTSLPAIQSTTPNSVNSQFTQGGNVPGMPGIPGAAGKPMPTLNPYAAQQAQPTRSFNGPVQYGQHTPSQAPEKPFANYEAAPVLSPYMNLYRRDNFTGIDNYNLYVKPALEAEQKRKQMQNQLNTVQQNQNQTKVQQQTQFNTNVGAQTVGAAYGQMNTGTNTNRPGASYGFSGSGPTVHVNPEANQEKTDKEKMDEEAEEDEDKEEEKKAAYFNPYAPNRRGVVRPHYEPAGK
ncbi:MAG: hypothetical protein E7028_04115 [Planctomycetaceae bacterium]|nr:hypothetical protein [Planctomycetaceae bacterium]MBQ2822905.1 hypothetical protein [Thermoguttaceae bacterium]